MSRPLALTEINLRKETILNIKHATKIIADSYTYTYIHAHGWSNKNTTLRAQPSGRLEDDH
jgi:hypothetical protein